MATSTTYGGYTAKAADIDLVMKFRRNLEPLMKLLGASDLQVLAPGTNLKTYTTTGTIQDGSADAGAAITKSTFSTVAAQKELTFKKWYKEIPIEDIAQQGYEGAVVATDEQLLSAIQKAIRSTIIGSLSTGSGSAEGTTFQSAFANTWAAVEAAFEDDAASPVYFVNYDTVADYLGTATVSIQTAFGINYIENFFGIPGTVILDSNVPDSYIYGTAKENLVIAASDCSNILGMELEIDPSGIIAVHHDPNYGYGALGTAAYCGICVFPKYADRVVKGLVDPS